MLLMWLLHKLPLCFCISGMGGGEGERFEGKMGRKLQLLLVMLLVVGGWWMRIEGGCGGQNGFLLVVVVVVVVVEVGESGGEVDAEKVVRLKQIRAQRDTLSLSPCLQQNVMLQASLLAYQSNKKIFSTSVCHKPCQFALQACSSHPPPPLQRPKRDILQFMESHIIQGSA